MSLPAGWSTTTMAEACALVQSGGTPKTGFSKQPGIPFLKVYNIVDQRISFDYRPQFVDRQIHEGELRKSKVLPGDVLMNIVGPPLGKVAIVPPTFTEWNVNQALTIFRPSAVVLSRWLYYFLCGGGSVLSVINETRGSAGQVNISLSQCRNFEIALPPVAEQRRIVAKIDSLSSKSRRASDHLDHIPRLVEKYKQAILHRVFSSTKGTILALSEIVLPEAPVRYGVIQPGTIKDTGAPLIRVCDLKDGRVAWSDLRRISPEIDANYADARVQAGDVLVSVVGTIGRVALVTEPKEPTNIARAVARVRPNPRLVLPEWLAWRLQSSDCQGFFQLEAREVARKTLNIAQLKTVRIAVPTLAEQAAAIEIATRAFAWIDRLASEAGSARKLIDHLDKTILSKAFRGELVPQDPSDEPASVVLEEIRAERSTATTIGRGKGRQRISTSSSSDFSSP